MRLFVPTILEPSLSVAARFIKIQHDYHIYYHLETGDFRKYNNSVWKIYNAKIHIKLTINLLTRDKAEVSALSVINNAEEYC